MAGTVAFDLPQDCLAEEMLRHPGDPVAVISGSRVTLPYAMAEGRHEHLALFNLLIRC